MKFFVFFLVFASVSAFSKTSSPADLEKKCMAGDQKACATLRSGKKVDVLPISGGVSVQFQGAKLVDRTGCSHEVDNFVELTAKDYDSQGATAQRFAIADIAFPDHAEAIQKLGNQCVLRVNGYTRDQNEFPLKAKIGANQYESVACVENKSKPVVQKVFGQIRKDCLFLVRCSDLTKQGTILVDWHQNRKDMKLLELPMPDLSDSQMAEVKDKAIKTADVAFLKEYVSNQFCIELQ